MNHKLTEAKLARLREVEMARRAIPTRRQLAKELGVSQSLLNQVARKLHSVPRGTNSKMQLDIIELVLVKP
jgi:predicted RecB family endonuclease